MTRINRPDNSFVAVILFRFSKSLALQLEPTDYRNEEEGVGNEAQFDRSVEFVNFAGRRKLVVPLALLQSQNKNKPRRLMIAHPSIHSSPCALAFFFFKKKKGHRRLSPLRGLPFFLLLVVMLLVGKVDRASGKTPTGKEEKNSCWMGRPV